MAGRIVSDLTDAVKKLNTLYNSSSTPPNPGEEDYLIWTDLLSAAISLWENEEGMLWNQLFVKLADAADGDKVTTTGTSYVTPTNFKFPNSAYVYLGDGTQKTAFKVLKQQDVSLYANDTGNWCYFLLDTTPTLEFNPNLTLTAGQTISYNYYKYANDVATGTDKFDMSDPMFAVYYALSELKKEEGDISALQIATQKLEAMKTLNYMTAENQENTTINAVGAGFGSIGNRPVEK